MTMTPTHLSGKNAPLSVVYPTFASTFIFISIISYFYLRKIAKEETYQYKELIKNKEQ